MKRIGWGTGWRRWMAVGLGGLAALIGNLTQASISVTLAWDRNTETNLAGYFLFYGTSPGVYAQKINVGNRTNYTIAALSEGLTYFFAVSAFNTLGVEGNPSTEISYAAPGAATNLPPTLNPIANLVLNENAGVQTVALTGISSGASNEVQRLTITATSSNQALIPNPAVTYASPNSSGTLSFAPVPNAFGSAAISVTVSDGQAQTSRSFTVTVNPLPLHQWRAQYFSQADLSDPAKETTVWGDLADPDNDGRPNLLEYALGLDPTRGDSTEGAILITLADPDGSKYLSFTFRHRKNEPTLLYVPEVSADQQVWNSGEAFITLVGSYDPSTDFQVSTYQDLSPVLPGAPRFVRLRVIKNN